MAWPQLDWSQLSVGAVLGSVATWIGGIARSFFDARMQEWGKDKDEARKIGAESREELRNAAERRQAVADLLARHGNELLALKTSLKGSGDLLTASHHLQEIHQFFRANSQYIELARNAQFLEQWPIGLKAELTYNPNKYGTGAEKLAILKNDVNGLKVSER